MDIKTFDGTGRTPREAQVQAIKWLQNNWDSAGIFVLNLPTGVGKSAILRAIQLAHTGTVGLIPTNILIDQYINTYPDLNYFRGAEHYTCGDDGFTCQDKTILHIKHAPDCPYVEAKERALAGASTLFNPISYYYLTKSDRYEEPEVVVIDEAHKLVEMLMLLTTCSFRKGYYNYPVINNDVELLAWLGQTAEDLHRLKSKKSSPEERLQTERLIQKIKTVVHSFTNNPQDFVYYTREEKYRKGKDEYLCISPIQPPKWLIDKILKGKKVILMSATMLKSDAWELGLSKFSYLDIPSPIPKENRPVMYLPHTEAMNYKTSEESIAEYIQRIIAKYPNRNTIIHLSYGWVERIKKFFPDALFNTPETKVETLQKFKQKGGVWLAAGCAEGIDLPGDECRLTIIPMLLRGNPHDPVTKKQLARQSGWLMYELSALKTVIQQTGRGTRAVDDHSITVIGDNSFPRLFMKNKAHLPKSFSDSIVWKQK